MIVSSFEVLLQPIGPSKKTTAAAPVTPALAGEVLRKDFVPPQFAASGLPFTIPTALQGYFLYVSNPSPAVASGIRVGFVSEAPQVLAATVSGSGPAFFSISNAQPPLLNGNTTTSGISFGQLSVSGAFAYTDLPSLPASGTVLLGLIPNYLSPTLVSSGPVARGYVDIRTTNGQQYSLAVSAQTRVVFFEPNNSSSGGMDTSEAAYSMPSPNGGIAFTISGA